MPRGPEREEVDAPVSKRRAPDLTARSKVPVQSLVVVAGDRQTAERVVKQCLELPERPTRRGQSSRWLCESRLPRASHSRRRSGKRHGCGEAGPHSHTVGASVASDNGPSPGRARPTCGARAVGRRPPSRFIPASGQRYPRLPRRSSEKTLDQASVPASGVCPGEVEPYLQGFALAGTAIGFCPSEVSAWLPRLPPCFAYVRTAVPGATHLFCESDGATVCSWM